jgi:hypothetical protein
LFEIILHYLFSYFRFQMLEMYFLKKETLVKKNTLNLWLVLAAIVSGSSIMATCDVSQDCAAVCSTQCSVSKNLWLPRSFSSNPSLEITQEKNVFQTESNRSEWNGTFSFATTYGQNFGVKCNDCKNLGSLPFWSGTNVMTAGNNDGAAGVNLDAWNFGMGNIDVDANGLGGTITLNPKVTQVGTDFLLYFTQFKDKRGLFFKIHAPVGAISVDPQMSQNGIEAVDTNAFGPMTTSGTAYTLTYATTYPSLEDRHKTLTGAFAGGIGQDNSLNGHTANQPDLKYGRISTCKQTAIRLADLSMSIGYNLFAGEKGILGIGFKATCPTGNVPTAEYMLEPIFGRGGAWGVGGEVMSHYKAWQNDAQTKYLDFWLQGEVLHLVPGRTGLRSFDLKANGVGSKYILLQHFHQEPAGGIVADFLQQAINITTLPVISKFAVEGSVSLMADYHCNNWNLAIGGEFWGRSKENLSINVCSAIDLKDVNLNQYAVVGRQASSVNILSGSGTPPLQINTTQTAPGPYNPYIILCEPAAKINKSQDQVTLVGGAANLITFPWTSATIPTGLADATVAANRIPANLTEALDICGAAASKAYTGKVFGQLGYTWNDCHYTPNLSFVGSAEFTNKTNSAVQMWSAGLQGSINF